MIKKTLTTLLGSSILSFYLVGCASTNNNQSEVTNQTLDILAQSSQQALIAQKSYENMKLAQISQLKTKQAKFDVDLINANYIGSPEVLLTAIASNYGYRYIESGRPKTLPIVNFTNRQVTGFELTKDIGVFIDGYADILIDNQNKTINLQYK